MPPEANLRRSDQPPASSPTPLGGDKRTHIRHHQPQKPTVRVKAGQVQGEIAAPARQQTDEVTVTTLEPTHKMRLATPEQITARVNRVRKACGVLLATLSILLGACESPPKTAFSAFTADSLLNELVAIHTSDSNSGKDGDWCTPGQDEIESVEEHAVRYLASELGLACAQRVLLSMTRGIDALSVFERQDVMAWDEQRSWGDAVYIALFFSTQSRNDEPLARANLLPLATALEGLRALHTENEEFTKNIVISISEANGLGVEGWLPQFPELSRSYTYTTTGTQTAARPPPHIPRLVGKGSGWVIGFAAAPEFFSSASVHGRLANAEGTAIRPPETGELLPAPTGFAIHAAFWPAVDNSDQLPSLTEVGRRFIRDFRMVHEPPPQCANLPWAVQWLCHSTSSSRWLPWIGGILLPLLILYAAVKISMAEAETVLEYLKRSIGADEQFQRGLEGSVDDLTRRIDSLHRQTNQLYSKQTSIGQNLYSRRDDNAFRRWQLWIGQRRYNRLTKRSATLKPLLKDRLRQKKDAEEQLRRTEARLQNLEKLKEEWEEEKKGSDRLQNLGTDIWSHVRKTIIEKETGLALVTGIITCAGAFSAAFMVESGHLLAFAADQRWGVFLLVSIIFAGALVWADRVDALTLGACVVCFIGLDTIELSPFDETTAVTRLSDLYDSQTVTLMFGTVALLLSMRAVIASPRAKRDEADKDKDVTVISEGKKLGENKEKLWLGFLSAAYVVLVYHTVSPAVWHIVGGGRQHGLLAVTAVAVATLLLPVIMLWLKVGASKNGQWKDLTSASVE